MEKNTAKKHKRWPPSLNELSGDLFYARPSKININKSTLIVTLGASFAIEIAKWLQNKKFNYYYSIVIFVSTKMTLNETF